MSFSKGPGRWCGYQSETDTHGSWQLHSSIYLSVHQPINLSAHPVIYLLVNHLSVLIFVHLSISSHTYMYRSIHPPIQQSSYPSIHHLALCPPVFSIFLFSISFYKRFAMGCKKIHTIIKNKQMHTQRIGKV